jgi:hypothetical protein
MGITKPIDALSQVLDLIVAIPKSIGGVSPT